VEAQPAGRGTQLGGPPRPWHGCQKRGDALTSQVSVLGPRPQSITTSNSRRSKPPKHQLNKNDYKCLELFTRGPFKSPACIVQNISTKHLQGSHDHYYINRKSPLDTILARVGATCEDVIDVDLRGDDGSGSSKHGDERLRSWGLVSARNSGSSKAISQPNRTHAKASTLAAP
jgi:hypothetical protein